MADCGSNGQSWRTGTSSTVVNLDSSLCLEERSGWPVMGSCEPSKSTQQVKPHLIMHVGGVPVGRLYVITPDMFWNKCRFEPLVS